MLNIDTKQLKVGQQIKFNNDRLWFTIQARNDRFIICNSVTKRGTFHTIIDLEKNIRGDDNLVLHEGYCDQVHCEARLKDFADGEIEISHRNNVPLNIIKQRD